MKIILDPGHTQSENIGANPAYREGTEMYHFAHILAEVLGKLGHKVSITRNSITDNPSLSERGMLAKGADLFLSLHSDWASTQNQVIIFDDHNPDYANGALANAFANSLGQFWDCTAKVVYRGYDDVWRKTPKAGISNYFGVLRAAYARSNMLIEVFNHRNKAACEAFMMEGVKNSVAKLMATCIQSHYKLTATPSGGKQPAKYRVISGSYTDREGAILRVKQLQKAGFDAWILPI
jgi:N-acetylmuramoyl-L-alanine amidase